MMALNAALPRDRAAAEQRLRQRYVSVVAINPAVLPCDPAALPRDRAAAAEQRGGGRAWHSADGPG